MQFHFCQPCVEKQNFLKNEVLQVGQMLQAIMGPTPLATLKCPACQIQFMEFRNQGKLGCPHDYDSMRSGLDPIIKRVQRHVRHVGKRPKRLPYKPESTSQIISLRRELQLAIETENYPLAIRLRDTIKSMDHEHKGRPADEHR
ncbi:MAG: UvrB/UvrC motif-containing protein [Planctomycetota bacterium]